MFEAFLQPYFRVELRRARKDIFLHLEQGNISVQEYNMQFNSLSWYAPSVVAEISERIHRFVGSLEQHLINECTTPSLNPSMDISRIQSYAHYLEDRKRKQRATQEHNQS